MDNVRKETHVVSVMTDWPLETVAVVRDEKDDLLPNQIRRPRLTARETNPQENQATEMKALQTKRAKFRADTEIVSALKKLLYTHSNLRKRGSFEEQRAPNSDRFLRGRQTAYMIYEYFGANGAYEAAQGFADLFTMSLQNDDVQDFDIRWDHALLIVIEMRSGAILEGLHKSKLQDSVQLQTDGLV